MTESEKIDALEKRLAALEKSKRHRRWLWISIATALPLSLWAATAIPNTFSDGDVLSAEKLNANFAALAAADSTPAGTIVAFGGQTAPDGWALCDGTLTSRTTRAKLFAAIGTAFGAGDGSTTFHLPDLRGRFLRGVDGSAGVDPDKATRTAMNAGGATGNAVGTIQLDDFKSHNHVLVGTTSGAVPNVMPFLTATGAQNYNTNNTGGNETRPVNAYVNWIIKY